MGDELKWVLKEGDGCIFVLVFHLMHSLWISYQLSV